MKRKSLGKLCLNCWCSTCQNAIMNKDSICYGWCEEHCKGEGLLFYPRDKEVCEHYKEIEE